MKENLINDLKKIFGEKNVFSTYEERLCYSYDATNTSFMPDAVVIPQNTEQVVQVMKYASAHKIPIVSRGAGSGYTGGSLPVKGGIVVSFEQMNKILSVNKEKMYAVIEPGVVTQNFFDEMEKLGLFYPPDPSSLKTSTLGGNVAECAGGLRGRKYGVTKNYVLGLEFVLYDGEIVPTGVLSPEEDLGYDLSGIIIGSEGTLAVITKIALKLLKKPAYEETILAGFNQMEDAARVVADITASGITPSILEFIDGDTLACVLEFIQTDRVEKAEAVLLIETDGEKEQAHKEAEEIIKICQKNNAKSLKFADTQEEKDNLWKIRRSVSASLLRIAPTKVNEDVCVPPSQLPELVRGIKKLSKDYNVQINTFGHAGDGNLHVNFMTDSRDKEKMHRVEQAVEKLFDLTLKLGGTLSGEHGIGTTKAKFMEKEVGKSGIEFMKKVKRAFDPDGIINPGKIFPE
ncbi:MAG: FAD-linked oxidase C-terminal domain-containing protein [candidate division Zixibacteria bacterium]|nr:FAD-linked oxidase C-terminal domain-containing protein [candidate division Zixibacteria bacterium]